MENSDRGEIRSRGMQVEDQGSVWAFWGGVVEGDYEGGGLVLREH